MSNNQLKDYVSSEMLKRLICRAENGDRYTLAALRELQERRKTGADSKPVAYIDKQWTLVYYAPPMSVGLKIGDKLYSHAQQTVVPEEKPMPNSLSMYAVDAVAAIAEVRGWNACRAAMLNGGKS
ncbi:hypothetical protein R8O69_003349 [Klebsiella oxytoca]|nr:hypothetical protein [Klebsiella oxytoca]ELT9977659.1 hypothetical protein [Klebsiella oxytoca]